MKATKVLPHDHEQRLNSKVQSTTQQNLQDDAFFCPHPECFMAGTCQKAPQFPTSPLPTGTRVLFRLR